MWLLKMNDKLLTQSQDIGLLLSYPHSLTTEKEDDTTLSPRQYDRRKRDSGYCTDCSPALATKSSSCFTFESDCDGSEFELNVEFGNLDIDNDVFEENTVSDINIQSIDEYGDVDKEVEDLFSKSGELGQTNCISQSSEINPFRPAAPVQNIVEDLDDHSEYDSVKGDDSDIVGNSLCHTHKVLIVGNICQHCKISNFRPISRIIDTALPGLHDHTIREASGGLARPRFQPYTFSKGNLSSVIIETVCLLS